MPCNGRTISRFGPAVCDYFTLGSTPVLTDIKNMKPVSRLSRLHRADQGVRGCKEVTPYNLVLSTAVTSGPGNARSANTVRRAS
jgi:hypothetical protein